MTSTSTMKATAFPPNQTLYLTNLPSTKIQKYDIKVALYMLFSPYGPVIDVIAMKTQKMRGQAHVTFRDIQTSTQAMRALQGFEFFGHKIQIAYAKNKSDTLAKLDGTFRQPTAQNQTNVETTTLQQSIFNNPPSAFAAPTSSTLPPPPGPSAPTLPAKPSLPPAPVAVPAAAPSQDTNMVDAPAPEPGSVAGVKRPREEVDEEEDSDGDAAMDEDSDDD